MKYQSEFCAIAGMLLMANLSAEAYAHSPLRTVQKYTTDMENHWRPFSGRIAIGAKVPESVRDEPIPRVYIRGLGDRCGDRIAKINNVVYLFGEDRKVRFSIPLEDVSKITAIPEC